MKSLLALALIILNSVIISCGTSKDESASLPATFPVTNTTSAGSSIDQTGLNSEATTIDTSNKSSLFATTALNPAHGEPGHRCDIAVGAPLNSLPEQNTSSDIKKNSEITTTTPPETISTSIQTTDTKTKVAPGMNPAHGQPGHRCDIEVGAPLNSKPSQTNAINTQPAADLKSSIEQASPSSTPKTEPIAVAPGMNPAHGQPGHRCDIAVGSPLNSKPVENNSPTVLSADSTGGLKPKQ